VPTKPKRPCNKAGCPALTDGRFCEAHQKAEWRKHTNTRQAQKDQGERFDATEVYERDGYRCGLCEGKVDPALRYPEPMSASLDHITPLARGGAHTRANTQCAHLVCNLKKQARDGTGVVQRA
jgi:5-methylcytosine-specific restriction endonuclease McrA